MIHYSKLLYASCMVALSLNVSASQQKKERPNLLIIHTDEHNFRTLGCYRDLMSDEQALMWGKGIVVETPNLDRIANEGAICTSYYASNPVCSPSRASFVSGLYPVKAGVTKNGLHLKEEVVSFAQVLKNEGYATSYVGKWHLGGKGKPGFAPKNKFGFDDNRYMMNRRHWKQAFEKDGIIEVIGANKTKFDEGNLSSFMTDFLVTKTLEILERDKDKPFCHMISIPDPHGPNKVRPPYDSMYDDMHFEDPRTMGIPAEDRPKWSFGKNGCDTLDQVKMRDYFGMVKCIDDNVGRILSFLEKENLVENTIVIFTSDHGDLMGEHNKHNKSSPYEGSARIPFIIRYPQGIESGKVISSAYTTVDFAPTILGLMGANKIANVQGKDASEDFSSKKSKVSDERIVYITTALGTWTAAVNDRYKLVLSPKDEPWLFDMEVDPDELTNFYTDPKYATIAKKFDKELNRQMIQYKDPALEKWEK